MKNFFLFYILFCLLGCGMEPEMPDLRTQLKPDLVRQLPVKVMLVELPKARSAALTSIDIRSNQITTWRSLEEQSLILEDGVVVATRGLAFDLMGSEVGLAPEKVFNGALGKSSAIRSFSFLGGENGIITLSYECTYSVHEPEMVNRLNLKLMLSSVREKCPRSGPDIENVYYFDAIGKQVSSKQWLGDALGYATLEFIN